MTDEEILCALIGQVSQAAGGRSELEVTTIITRPMWNAFLRAARLPEDSKPTPWSPFPSCCRVYGSHTIVIDRPHMASVSFR